MMPFRGFPKPKNKEWELVAEFALDDGAQRIVKDLKENAKINRKKIEIAVAGALYKLLFHSLMAECCVDAEKKIKLANAV